MTSIAWAILVTAILILLGVGFACYRLWVKSEDAKAEAAKLRADLMDDENIVPVILAVPDEDALHKNVAILARIKKYPLGWFTEDDSTYVVFRGLVLVATAPALYKRLQFATGAIPLPSSDPEGLAVELEELLGAGAYASILDRVPDGAVKRMVLDPGTLFCGKIKFVPRLFMDAAGMPQLQPYVAPGAS